MRSGPSGASAGGTEGTPLSGLGIGALVRKVNVGYRPLASTADSAGPVTSLVRGA